MTGRAPVLEAAPLMLAALSISPMQLYGQLLIGLINGSFYALLSLGLAVIFGMLNVVNFAHGAFYMVGAFVAYFLLEYGGINYWLALILSPLIVGLLGALVERTIIRRIASLDHLYGLLLTFGLALVIQGLFQNAFGSSGKPYPAPAALVRRLQSRLHVPAQISRLGDRRLVRRLHGDVVRDREDASSAPICAPPPRTRRWCAPSASTCR